MIKKEKQKLDDSYELKIEENNAVFTLNDDKKIPKKLTKETFYIYLKNKNKNSKYYNDYENISLLLGILINILLKK